MQRDEIRSKITLDHALFPQNLGVLGHHLDTLFAALDALGQFNYNFELIEAKPKVSISWPRWVYNHEDSSKDFICETEAEFASLVGNWSFKQKDADKAAIDPAEVQNKFNDMLKEAAAAPTASIEMKEPEVLEEKEPELPFEQSKE